MKIELRMVTLETIMFCHFQFFKVGNFKYRETLNYFAKLHFEWRVMVNLVDLSYNAIESEKVWKIFAQALQMLTKELWKNDFKRGLKGKQFKIKMSNIDVIFNYFL